MSLTASVIIGCVLSSAAQYDVPPSIVWTLLAVEGGQVGTVSQNTNGTEDMGPMQINTIWIDDLEKHYGVGESRVRDKLINDPCFNIGVGTWILKTEIARAKGNFWTGVLRYHSRTPRHQSRYLGLLRSRIERLFGPAGFSGRPLPVVPETVYDLPVLRGLPRGDDKPAGATPAPATRAATSPTETGRSRP